MRPFSILLCFLTALLPLHTLAQEIPQTQQAGILSGTVTDSDGALIAGAQVTLTLGPASRTTTSGSDGHFVFPALGIGPFTISAKANGMEAASYQGTLYCNESIEIPPLALKIGSATTDVEVTVSRQEIAEEQVKQEEHQRLFGAIPNFYVSYDWKAEPLTAKQKFKLAGRTLIDPVNLAITAGIAGLEQADDTFNGYGQGAQGYGKRFGAGLADFGIGTILGGAVLPSAFHQDPRYFYKGMGSIRSRALYALSTAVIARGDNGRRQFAYASILGDFGSAAISNVYYPAQNRDGAGLTISNGFLSVAFDGLGNLIQEFVLRKISPGLPASTPP
jgi:hypothetical protein